MFGYRAIAYSSVGLALLGFVVWGHHMFVAGQSQLATVIFSFLTFLVAIPSGVKVFNWLSTMYKGNISLETPMCYAVSFPAAVRDRRTDGDLPRHAFRSTCT
jgi:cytochrome c oxidase subunit 1